MESGNLVQLMLPSLSLNRQLAESCFGSDSGSVTDTTTVVSVTYVFSLYSSCLVQTRVASKKDNQKKTEATSNTRGLFH